LSPRCPSSACGKRSSPSSRISLTKKAETLREFSERKKLTNEKIEQILSGELNKKPKPKTSPPLKIKAKIYQKHFNSDITQTEMETIIDEALTEYFEKRKNNGIQEELE
jgi:ParB family chromosome partitioning protein